MTHRTLELRLDGIRINHSWCLGVVSHRCGGFGRAGMEVVAGRHVGQSQELVACQEMPEHFPNAKCRLWIGSSRNWSVLREWS